MRHLFVALVALTLLVVDAARAEDDDDARAVVNDDPRSVIENQLDAMAEDDWETAFGFASPALRTMFGTPERFSKMVRASYEIVWRHREARYIAGRAEGDLAVQIMEFVGEDGRVWRAVYELMLFDEEWRITGVVMREAPTEAT